MDLDPPISGVLARSAALLARLSPTAAGTRLQELVDVTQLPRPTVHRLLAELIALGVVTRTDERRYRLAPAIAEVGLNSAPPASLLHQEETRLIVQELADEVGDTVYLALRAHAMAVYLLRCDGDSPVRVYSVAVGEMKPLASSFAGIALLAGLDAHRQDAFIDAEARKAASASLAAARMRGIRTLIAEVRDRGWCGSTVSELPDVAGAACPVPRSDGPPVLALTVSASASRLHAGRMDGVGALLVRTASRLAAMG